MSLPLLNRRFIAIVQVAVLLTAAIVAVPADAAPSAAPATVDGVVVVWASGGARTTSHRLELERRGLHVRRTLLDGRAAVIDAEPDDVAALVEQLADLPGVTSVEPDYPVYLAWEPNDDYYSTGEQWAYSRIQAPAAWDVERGDGGVLVAVIDTGADLAHPDLAGRLDTANDRNFTVSTTSAAYTIASDDHGHGTHVAGIVAAQTNNVIGVAGTAPLVRVLPLKAIDARGEGDSSDVAAAISYAVSVGADVINMSLAFDYGVQVPVVEQAIQDAIAAGVIVVAASGNGGSSGVRYPAAYPECIAVGATTPADTRAPFSTYGQELDVVAPGGKASEPDPIGDAVLSTYWTSSGSTYAYMEGTSMAAPFVAGAAALLRSFVPTATAGEIRSAIEVSAKDISAAGFDNYTGNGLLQMRNALDYLTGQDTTPPTTTSNALPGYENVAPITLTANDGAGFGVAATYYRIDSGAWRRGTSLSITGYGPHTIDYWSDDVVGNQEDTNTDTFFIDDTKPPVTTSNAVAVYESTATVVLSASDTGGSGVASTWYAVDGDAPVTGDVVTVGTIGVHTFAFGSVDVAGNREDTRTADFTVRGVPIVSRRYGANRYATAATLSSGTYAAGSAPFVVMASGETFPDALSSSGLAGVLDAPLLLTAKNYLPVEIVGELQRLGTTRVLIAGGPAAVSGTVESALGGMGITVERVQGTDRFATAAAVAVRIASESGATPPRTAFVVRADTFPDALAVSSIAASRGFPVLLTGSTSLSPACAQAIVGLGITEVVIAGGDSAVSAGVAAAIDALPGVSVVRRGGVDRYETAAGIIRYGIARGWLSTGFVGVSTGANFPDALAGGVVAADRGGMALLTAPRSLSSGTAAVIDENGSDHLPIWVYGGPNAVSDTVVNTLTALRF
jgi:subtilisin family serine protease